MRCFPNRLYLGGTTPEGGVLLGPERPRTYEDLSDMRRSDTMQMSVQPILCFKDYPKIYTSSSITNIEAKAIWDNLNSKFVNNMSPEWDRFMTAIKLNKGLKETNHEQLYAYLKPHEKHVAQDRLIIERITPATNDQLAMIDLF
ncbi:hypothetical protein Tco_0140765 [Tanacetum coccineum]